MFVIQSQLQALERVLALEHKTLKAALTKESMIAAKLSGAIVPNCLLYVHSVT